MDTVAHTASKRDDLCMNAQLANYTQGPLVHNTMSHSKFLAAAPTCTCTRFLSAPCGSSSRLSSAPRDTAYTFQVPSCSRCITRYLKVSTGGARGHGGTGQADAGRVYGVHVSLSLQCLSFKCCTCGEPDIWIRV